MRRLLAPVARSQTDSCAPGLVETMKIELNRCQGAGHRLSAATEISSPWIDKVHRMNLSGIRSPGLPPNRTANAAWRYPSMASCVPLGSGV